MLVSKRSRVRYDDLVLRCCVMLSYSVLIFSTTAAIPHRCRRSFHRHRHPRRTATAAAATAAAAAVRRLLLRSCGWCLLCLFLKKKKKRLFFAMMIVVIEPGRSAVPRLILRGHRHRHLRPRPRRCCGAATAVLLLFSLARARVPKVFCVRCCGRPMLVCVDSAHMTGWHVFVLCVFVECLSQTQPNA